jgi:LacI family repressor for deo operon, udp, cdd, tsx, nupC, and nupG
MNLSESPAAIVAEDDFLAIGSMKYLLHRGIKIPDEVAVIGFDDILLSSMYEPSLSTISLPKEQIGSEAVKLLLSRIETPAARNRQVILDTKLVVRNSTVKGIPVEFEC